MTLEREDIGTTPTDPLVVAMHRIAPPVGEARDDYDIFCDLARRLGRLEAFSEGRSTREWLAHLYGRMRDGLAGAGVEAPDFETFWEQGELLLPQAPDDGGMLRAFREDPQGKPLPTPSGRLQLSSPTVASFGYADCPGHPAWLAPTEPPDAAYPLWLISNQPASKLHSQLDFGAHSLAQKRQGREVCTLHPQAAAARGIAEGDIVRVFNARGACLAAAALSEHMLPDVIQLPTGAWYDPVEGADGQVFCGHGNPNMLTRDIGTSSLAQGCSGQLTVAQVERWDGPLPPLRCHEPPAGA
jgi:biotin/methionine sulfoxide reductase